LGTDEIADRLISSGEVSPFIIVMPLEPEQNVQPPENQFAEALIYDLVQAVDAQYRTRPSSQYRAIGGLSRGGNWAIRIGLTNWAFFGSIGSHSGSLFVSDGPDQIRAWLDKIPPEAQPQIYLDIGEKDKWLQRILLFEEILDDYNIPHELHIYPGGHTEEYWESHLEQYIRWYACRW
jgi:enterochelin esterase-like enzyme